MVVLPWKMFNIPIKPFDIINLLAKIVDFVVVEVVSFHKFLHQFAVIPIHLLDSGLSWV